MKIYKLRCFLESTCYEEYILFVYLIVKAIHKKATAVPRFAEKKNL